MRIQSAIVFSCALLCAGCANWNSIHHSFRASDSNPESISIDAKQRVVIATTKVTVTELEPGKKLEEIVRRVCAEPSPDAISALASSLTGSGEVTSEKIHAALKLQAALSQTESAAFVGVRTQTVQLLRDGMYRLCEAYMADALDKRSYNRLQRRYQNLMMGLLSIEQLTGAVVAPQIALLAGATASKQGANELVRSQMADGYTDAKVRTKKATEARDAAARAKSDAEAAVKAISAKKAAEGDELSVANGKLTESTAAFDAATKDLEKANAREQVFKEGFEKSLAGAEVSAAGGSYQRQPVSQATQSSADFGKVAEAVQHIVETVINKALVVDECFLSVSDVSGSYQPKTAREVSDISVIVADAMNACSKMGIAEQAQKLLLDRLSADAVRLQDLNVALERQLAEARKANDEKSKTEIQEKLAVVKDDLNKKTTEISDAAKSLTTGVPSAVVNVPEPNKAPKSTEGTR